MFAKQFRRVSLFAVGAAFLFAGPAAQAGKGVDHTAEQPRPSYLGVSGSGIDFLNINGSYYCYAGTLGSLVKDSFGNLYILSNNHVLAQESTETPSESASPASIGDDIIQPGLLDENGDPNSCSPAGTDYTPYIVGKLSDWVPLDFLGGENYVDAAIASVDTSCGGSCIDPDGRILEIGGISGDTVPATVGTAVEKSGRTTALTTGTVSAVAVDVDIGYSYGTAHFVDQILVSGDKGAFIKAGDSGSLMVTRPTGTDLPQAVGLLFAGSQSGIAIANQIDDVLGAFRVQMVACGANCGDTSGGSGGGGSHGGGGGSHGGGGGGGHGPKIAARGLDVALDVLDRHRDALMANPDVVGTGLSVDRNGTPVIQVYTKGASRSVAHPIPSQLEKVRVQVVVTGEFKAF